LAFGYNVFGKKFILLKVISINVLCL